MSLVKNLYRNYGDFELAIPEWEIADQGITVLSGPSGSGKTSILRLLIGLDACPGLTWEFKGEDLAQLPVPQRRLGVVFQTLELFPHMTARENIVFAARARRIESGEQNQILGRLSEQLGLHSFLDRSVRVLSGGERQRVALARALIGRPRFLFLDEPFSSLDEDIKEEARKLLRLVVTERSLPTLLVTHDPRDIKALADHVVPISSLMTQP